MKSLVAIVTSLMLLQHVLLGCCWHHEMCAHGGQPHHACHGDDHATGGQINHTHDPPLPQDSGQICNEGHCWWLANHSSPQPPQLERLMETPLELQVLGAASLAPAATVEHLPHGTALPALPVRAHLWNQQLLI